ncbi:MAG: helix-turn-helix domain-containing protein, partial [Sphingomonas sp.]
IQRALLFREGDRIEADDVPVDPVETAPAPACAPVRETPAFVVPPAAPRRLADATRAEQARIIAEALAATNGHRVQAAARLGISERTLRYRLADLRAADLLAA